MIRFIGVILVVGLGLLAGCSTKFKTYNGPEVTWILVYKEQRKMYLMHNSEVLKSYDIGLGFAPEGHKAVEGDGRTPEGTYRVDRKNPNSQFYLSVGIDYPNAADRAHAAKLGKSPGGDIFIHGQSALLKSPPKDWTAGCISVKNREIEDIYAMVAIGTPITIYP